MAVGPVAPSPTGLSLSRPAPPRPRGGAPGQPVARQRRPARLHPLPAVPWVPGWSPAAPAPPSPSRRRARPSTPPGPGGGGGERPRPGRCSTAERLRPSSTASRGGPREGSGRAPVKDQPEERRGYFAGMAAFPLPVPLLPAALLQ